MLAQYTGFSLIMHTNSLEYTMTDQQFVLKWHYHETTLLQNLPYLLENDILSDVTLSVGAQHIKAHKIILAMCSVYFLQLFQASSMVKYKNIFYSAKNIYQLCQTFLDCLSRF